MEAYILNMDIKILIPLLVALISMLKILSETINENKKRFIFRLGEIQKAVTRQDQFGNEYMEFFGKTPENGYNSIFHIFHFIRETYFKISNSSLEISIDKPSRIVVYRISTVMITDMLYKRARKYRYLYAIAFFGIFPLIIYNFSKIPTFSEMLPFYFMIFILILIYWYDIKGTIIFTLKTSKNIEVTFQQKPKGLISSIYYFIRRISHKESDMKSNNQIIANHFDQIYKYLFHNIS